MPEIKTFVKQALMLLHGYWLLSDHALSFLVGALNLRAA